MFGFGNKKLSKEIIWGVGPSESQSGSLLPTDTKRDLFDL